MSTKLYELPRTKEGIKIYEPVSDGSEYLRFHHIDGAYSYCVSEKGNTIHLSASTPLVEHGDGFKIEREDDE